jgi:hypothetical protein
MKLPIFSILGLAVGGALAIGADAPRVTPNAEWAVARQQVTASRLDRKTSVSDSRSGPKPSPWVKLDIEAPVYRPTLPYGIEFASGWSLAIHASGSPDALGIATNAAPVQFPGLDQTGYLILQDPDACLELPPPFFGGAPPCSEAPSDETYVEFSPGTDQVGITDTSGNPGRMAALADPALSGKPRYDGVGDINGDFVLDETQVEIGPETGGTASDGVGYGADDDLPGLVILSPYGPGLVLNADFTRPTVRTQRNLAGFLHSVAYELRDATGATGFDATLVVPTGLIAPVMKIDGCVGTFTDGRCDGPSRYQIDGGPMRTTDASTGAQALYPEILAAQPYYEVRAFLVSGVAPSILSDRNHDGQVTAADARAAGYNVISNEELVRVRQYSTDICTGVPLVDVLYADFDHNGHATSEFICPAGPGQITPIPRAL